MEDTGRRRARARRHVRRRRRFAEGTRLLLPAPTVLTGVDPRSRPDVHTEIFGPVAAILTFVDDRRRVVAGRTTPPGVLVGYVFTQGPRPGAAASSERLEVGMVGLNTGLVSDPAAPFGGVKQSGLGREGGWSASTSSWSTS